MIENQISKFDIGLKFPLSTKKVYRLSYIVASLSDFIKNVINCDMDSNDLENLLEQEYMEIEVPMSLYTGMRETDLDMFIGIWSGKVSFNHFNIHEKRDYNVFAMAQFGRALLINQELVFMKQFERDYPLYPLPTIAAPL